MILKFSQNLWEKEKNEFLLSKNETNSFFFLRLLLFFLPTQLTYHFWPTFSYVYGLRVDYLSPTIYVTDILLFLSVGYLLCDASVRARVFSWVRLHKQKIVLCGVILGINLFFSQSFPNTVFGILKLVECIAFAFLLLYFLKRRPLSQFLIPFVASGVLQSVLAYGQFMNQGSLGGIWYYLGERTFSGITPGIANASLFGHLILRPYGTLPHPNLLAVYLLVCSSIVYFSSSETADAKKRLVYYLVLVCLYPALLLTLSRSVILLNVILVVLSLVSLRRKHVPVLTLSVGLLALSGAFVSILLPRFLSLFSDQSYSERVLYLKESIELLLAHPIAGVGIHAYLSSLGQIQHLGNIQPVHNIFVLYAVESGVLGIVVGCYFLYAYFKKYSFNLNSKTISILLGVIILGSLDHYFLTLQQGQLLLVFLLILFHRQNVVITE